MVEPSKIVLVHCGDSPETTKSSYLTIDPKWV